MRPIELTDLRQYNIRRETIINYPGTIVNYWLDIMRTLTTYEVMYVEYILPEMVNNTFNQNAVKPIQSNK